MDNSSPAGRTTPADPAPWEGDRFSLWSYATVLLRRRRLALTLPPLAAVVAGTISLLSTREYIASARFVPQEPASVQSSLSQLALTLGVAPTRASTESPLFYADLVRSRELMRDLVTRQYDLEGKVPFHGTLYDYFAIAVQDTEAATITAVEELRTITSVSTDRALGIVSLSVATRSPALSEAIMSGLLSLLNEYNLQRRQSRARAERTFVETRLRQVKDTMAAAEDALIDFYARNRRFQRTSELAAVEGRLQRRVTEQRQLHQSLLQSYEAARIEEVRNTPVITVLERPEGFVEPKRRGTVRKAITAFVLTAVLVGIFALLDEYFRRTKASGQTDFAQFLDVLRDAAGGARKVFRRRP